MEEDRIGCGAALLFLLTAFLAIALIVCGICALVNGGTLDGYLPENDVVAALETTPTPELEPAVAYQADGDWYINIVVIDENGEEHLHRVQVIVCEVEDEKGLKYFIPTPNPSVLY
ncbi:MAG: hypothetical protein K6G36_01085 [Candidatus Saccharibacteria bacterium]|nr:hypothetical protein [Candidatus Saccharibacteria bacterium]